MKNNANLFPCYVLFEDLFRKVSENNAKNSVQMDPWREPTLRKGATTLRQNEQFQKTGMVPINLVQ